MKLSESYLIIRELIEKRMSVELEAFPQRLQLAAMDFILNGGKFIRPYLALKSAELVSNDPKYRSDKDEAATSVAIAVELIHSFSLIQDDIMDGDDFRRGRPAVHKAHGIPMAILAADLLQLKANKILQSSPRYREILWEKCIEGCEESCLGQAMDINLISSKEKKYLEVSTKKTAPLFKASCEMGGVCGGATDEDLKNLSDFGQNFGIAYQIKDDLDDKDQPKASEEEKRIYINKALKAIEKYPNNEAFIEVLKLLD